MPEPDLIGERELAAVAATLYDMVCANAEPLAKTKRLADICSEVSKAIATFQRVSGLE